MAEEKRHPEWEGKVSADIKSATAKQVWPLVEDFCSLDKWYPGVDTCRQVEGVYGEPGLVRYVTATIASPPPPNDADQKPKTVVKWCYETLRSIDPVQRRLSYQITENNLGVRFYVAEWEVIENKDGDDAGGCRIEWRFTADPMEGQTLEGFCGYIQSSLNGITEKMEKALQADDK
ncbi:hypothetical protein L2E82_28053 [Cichorium intybus]|uniref:Uncharacterized protein n=1 Tax=Cichorium intybus TaxID=13427 RepID=A0ACB9CUZ8_CICIN|nr:hypothetical protein L2E82_28053 [Cichorium intybus]